MGDLKQTAPLGGGAQVGAAALETTLPGRPPGAIGASLEATAPGIEGPPLAGALERGAAVGRYVILDRLGAGGMGVVYKAWDPELDRKVALKVIHAQGSEGEGATVGRMRLLREAQAMARLAHPNVIAVHDVGTLGDEVFVAMELVEGPTLEVWLQQRRPLGEVLEVFRQAGSGLAAAHNVGLVHRDFKPTNVLLGKDGRVRVLDFGLARLPSAEMDITGPPMQAVPLVRSPASITTAGIVVGTPLYMAPEQWRGEAIDGRADQFAFAVVLYQALFGQHPYHRGEPSEVAKDVLASPLREPPAGYSAPPWLWSALCRALDRAPGLRFSSMDELLAALAAPPSRGRALALLLGAGLLGLVGVGLVLHDPLRPCRGAERHLAGVWDDGVRKAVERSLAASARPFSQRTAREVIAELDAYAGAWKQMREEACAATSVRREQSAELLDLRMSCLDARLGQLRAAGKLLSEASEELAPQARRIAASPAPISDCADVRALRAPVALPTAPTDRDRLRAARDALSEADVLERANRFDAEAPIVERVIAEARALKYQPLEAEAMIHRALLLSQKGKLAEAIDTLIEASLFAESSRADGILFGAATQLVYTLQQQKGRKADAIFWERRARALLDRLGRPPREEARLEQSLANALFADQRFADAKDAVRRAIAALEVAQPPDPVALGEAYNVLANVEHALSDDASSERHNEHSREIFERALGPDHPRLAMLLSNRGMIYEEQARNGEAEASYQRAIEAWERSLGRDHANLAYPLNNLGLFYVRQERFGEAEPVLARALAIRIARLGPEHPQVGVVESNLGLLADHRRHWDEAQAHYRRALAIWDKTLPPSHPHVAVGLRGLGHALLELGRPREALPLLERARSGKQPGLDPSDRALGEVFYARALWETGHDRARARELLLKARGVIAKAADDPATGKLQRRELADADRLLARMGRGGKQR